MSQFVRRVQRVLKEPLSLPALEEVPFNTELFTTSDYIDAGIYKQICSTMKISSTTTWLEGGHRVRFHYVHTGTRRQEALFFLWLTKKMLSILGVLRRDMDILLVASNFKKLSGKSHVLRPRNVNSGYTIKFLERDYSQVVIYRREEMSKVLIHELIHALELDRPYLEGDERLRAFFGGMTGTLRVNEAFTDAFACYMNVLVYCTLGGHAIRPVLETERKYILAQAYRVLSMYGTWNERGDGHWVVRRGREEEHTHGISYYILKGVLYAKLDKFLGSLRKDGYHLRDTKAFLAMLEDGILKRNSVFWKLMRSVQISGGITQNSMRMSYADPVIYSKKENHLKLAGV